MNSTSKSWLSDLLILACLIGIFYALLLGTRPLMSPDEGRYAEIAREMVITGDYLTPHLDGLKYFEKPPLFYWLETLPIKAFGLQEWSLRSITAIMGLLGCLITYITARKLFDRRTAVLASIILATSPLYYILAHFITLDMTVTVFLTASLYAFILGTREPPGIKRNYYMWAMYIFAALATLTKGLIGVVFPGLIIFAWICLMNEWRNLKTYCLFSGAILFLAIAAPWHILVQMKNPEFFRFYFIDQHFLRYLTDYAQRQQSVWFFPACLVLGFFPWTGFMLQAIFHNFPKTWQQRHQHKEAIFFALWAILIFTFFLCSQSQLLSYIVPILPPLAILVGRYLNFTWLRQAVGINIGLIINLALSLALVVVSYIFLHKQIHTTVNYNGIYLYISLLLMCCNAIAILLLLWSKKNIHIFTTLTLFIALFLISINLSYPTLDTRPVKQLAIKLKPLLQSADKVISYHYYYQDLPVYIQRVVTVVAWQGELAFGVLHKPNQATVISDKTFCQQWNSPQRIFMIMPRDSYDQLRRNNVKLFFIAETQKNILVTNQSIKP